MIITEILKRPNIGHTPVLMHDGATKYIEVIFYGDCTCEQYQAYYQERRLNTDAIMQRIVIETRYDGNNIRVYAEYIGVLVRIKKAYFGSNVAYRNRIGYDLYPIYKDNFENYYRYPSLIATNNSNAKECEFGKIITMDEFSKMYANDTERMDILQEINKI